MNPQSDRGRAWVAIVLAIGIATAVNLITFAVLYDAIVSAGPGLSENATQVLTAAFGGIVGVLGAYVGYQAGRESQASVTQAHEDGRTAVTTELQAFNEVGTSTEARPTAEFHTYEPAAPEPE